MAADSGKQRETGEGARRASQAWREEVERKEARKLEARRKKHRTIWFGLGMMGLVGWSVAIPTLVGIALGLWIDARWPSRFSWTLMLMVAGLALGCYNAWHWIQKERSDD